MRWLSLGFLASLLVGCEQSSHRALAPLQASEPSPVQPASRPDPIPVAPPAEPPAATSADVLAETTAPGTSSPIALAEGEALRVGGDLFAKAERRDDGFVWQQLAVTTPLPRGYPPPTPPGAIELKHYPAVRRAEYDGRRNADRGMNSGFWPLFRHITARDIEMTSPVEMDYHGMSLANNADGARQTAAAGGPEPDEWTMSFLYRTADLGPTGIDGPVRVADAPSVVVLSVGLRGDYTQARVRAGLDQLAEWIASQDDWEPAGSARALFYNGPDTRRQNLWGEAQIPIRLKATPRAAAR